MISLLEEGKRVGPVFFFVINRKHSFFKLFATQSDLVLIFQAFELLC